MKAPAQNKRRGTAYHALHLKYPYSFSPLKELDLRHFENNLGPTAELQQVAGVEVDEQQSGTRIEQQVAQGIEKPVTGKIWNRQTIAINAHETGLATPVRNVHRALAIDVHITGDKEGIRLGDYRPSRIIQPIEIVRDAGRRIRQRHRMKLP